MQPKKLAALLFLILALILILAQLYLPKKEAHAQQEKIFFAAVQPRAFQLVSYGEQSAFFAALALESSGVSFANITLSCSQEQQKGNFCMLEHPHASGFDAAGMKGGFEEGLRAFGLEAKKVPKSALQNCVGAIILIPTGIMPSDIEETLSTAQQAGSQIVFAGEISHFSIDSFGQVQKLPANRSMQKLLQQIEVYPSSLNSNLFSAGYALALSKIYAQGENSFSSSMRLSPSSPSHNLSLVAYAPKNTSSGFCRLAYEAHSTEGRRAGGISQSAKLSKLPPIGGSQEIFSSQSPHFSVWVEPAENSQLALYATASDFSGSAARKKIFEGSIRSGWLGGFDLHNLSRAGYYIVSVEDQFARAYAKSLLRVQELQVKISSTDGTTYRFAASIDGKPIDSQFATVSLEGSSSSMRYPVSSGAFAVAARPSSSESAFIVELLGVRQRIPFSQQRNPALSRLLQFAAPALLATLLLILMLGRKQKRKYSLRVPDFSQQPQQQLQISQQDFLRAFKVANAHFGWGRLPLDCGELSIGLRKLCGSKGALMQLSRQGIEDALLQMQKAGKVKGHAGFFAPSGWNLDIEEAASMRVLANILVQKGCVFAPLRAYTDSISASCPTEHVRVRICPADFSKLAPKISPGKKEILAFGSLQQLRAFQAWLQGGSQNAAKFSLLVKNKKLFLCVSSELGELL